MKVAAIIEYNGNQEQIQALHPAHHKYFRQLVENDQMQLAGPLDGDAGAVWVLEVENVEAAEKIIKGDPYVAAGVMVNWRMCPFAYWAGKEATAA